MKNIYLFHWLIILFIIVSEQGCVTHELVTRRSELMDQNKSGTITVTMKDKTQYELTSYALKDSLLLGIGSLIKDGDRIAFSGSIPLTDVEYILSRNVNYIKAFLSAGIMTFFAVNLISALGESPDPSFRSTYGIYYPPTTGGGSNGSCPFIYSFDKNKYVREGEAFGIGFGKGLELTTCTPLSSLKDSNNVLKIRITNERPETHFFNSVELRTVEVDTNVTVYADCNNSLWQAYHLIAPNSATDYSSQNILNNISSVDNNYWESDVSQTNINAKYEDVIDLTFLNSARNKNGSLIIHGINTYLGNAIYKQMFEFLGDEAGNFMVDAERDPELISTLRNWITESAIKVSVWNGERWEKSGIINPEANEVPFAKLVRINTASISSDTIKVRLTCLTDAWKIDAVQLGWTDTSPLNSKSVKLLSALGADGSDISRQLSKIDNDYWIQLPPDKMELTFQAPTASSDKKLFYALYATGYLHEWFPARKESSNITTVNFISSGTRSTYIKNLIKHEDLFLPLIYSEWKKVKRNHAVQQ